MDKDPHINSLKPDERRSIMANRLSQIVDSYGGNFNESEYVNKRTPLLFRCSNGHEWKSQPQSVLNGSWCRECWEKNTAGKHLKLVDGLNQAQKIAADRGGFCLSDEFETARKKLLWRCQNGHEWKAALSDIKKGTWCPDCSSGARERLVRFYFEKITNTKFIKKKPEWLLNERGNRMELDGYSASLNLAFEHQGEQHYQEVPHFNRRDETLQNRMKDDVQKRLLCKEHGVQLIEVPYSIKTENLPNWIYVTIYKVNSSLNLKKTLDIQKIEYAESTELKNLLNLAIERGGKCLSTIYFGSDKKHLFQCAKGHEWKATATNIKSGTWCPICKPERIAQSKRKHSVSSMRSLAEKRSGKFLSSIFNSVNDKYLWECKHGHVWTAAPTDIVKGTWCPVCAKDGLRGTIEAMQIIARARGGLCLSTTYVNSQTKLRWKCHEGHEWEARPDNVKNKNSWCAICSKKK